jgi:hypothetical protein
VPPHVAERTPCRNVFDKEPPSVEIPVLSLGFDPTNADASGRTFALGMVKRW